MSHELDGIKEKTSEKNESLSMIVEADTKAISENRKKTLLKLCDLHPEFLSIAAVSGQIKEVLKRNGKEDRGPYQGRDPLRVYPDERRDPLRVYPDDERDPFYPQGEPR